MQYRDSWNRVSGLILAVVNFLAHLSSNPDGRGWYRRSTLCYRGLQNGLDCDGLQNKTLLAGAFLSVQSRSGGTKEGHQCRSVIRTHPPASRRQRQHKGSDDLQDVMGKDTDTELEPAADPCQDRASHNPKP